MAKYRVQAEEIPVTSESGTLNRTEEYITKELYSETSDTVQSIGKHTSDQTPDKCEYLHEQSTANYQPDSEIGNPSHGLCLTDTAWALPLKPSVPPASHTYTKDGASVYTSEYIKPKPSDLVAVSKPLSTKKKIFIGIGVSAGIVLLLGGAVAAGLLISDGSLHNQTQANDTLNETTPAQDATKAPSATKAPGAGDQPSTESWAPWNAWSTCDTTCGPGHKQRSRTCSGDDCIGSDVQSAVCNLRECPRKADTYNQWGRWGSWTQCGTSCGDSTQRRARICTQNTNKLDCIGDSSQVRVCNEGICPDCSLPCSGSWDAGCVVCTCSGGVLTGRVTTQLGGPLDNVTVSPSDKPYTELAVTGMNGGFSVNGICDGQELLFTLSGYQSDTIVYSGESNVVVVMKKIVPLTITKQPLSTGRLASSCVELRCDANGSPQAEYYEWFKEGMLILGESGVLYTKTNLKSEDTGLYRCRASNDYSAVISNEVLLNVKGLESEFCQSNPLVHNQNLPSGCTYNGKTQVDVGKCSTGVCSKGGESACSENNYECGIITSDLLDIDCGTYRMAMQVVTECGCVAKGKVYLELLGTVVDAADDNLLSGILITYEDVSVTSDANGEFAVTLTPGTTRMTLSFTDPSGRYSQQVSSFNIGQNLVGSIEHNIALNRRPKPIIISPVNEILLELGLDDAQPAFADLVIPPNSVFDVDGNPFVGDVSLTMNTFNPANPSQAISPPGDFTAIGPDGEEELLESAGMMQLNMQDMSGNSLKLGGNIEILLPESVLGNPEDIGVLKFWILNEDGRWVYSSDINSQPSGRRKKRYIYSTTVRGIDIDSVWCNFDSIKDQICHTKIRAYQTDDFNENEQLANVDVQVVTLPSGSSIGTTLTRIRSAGDDNADNNGYCIVHPCNSKRSTTVHDYHGYIIADYQGTKLTPAKDNFDASMDYALVDDKIYAKFDYFTSPDGPFYDWDYYWTSSQQCSEADITDRHFRFYRSVGGDCASTSYTRLEMQTADTLQQEFKYLWYPENTQGGYRSCYIKAVTSWDWQTKIEAISAAAATENDVLLDGEVFGVRSECTENKATCLEIRPPFGVSVNGVDVLSGDTLLTLRVVNEKPLSVHINTNLSNILHFIDSSDPSIVQFDLMNHDYGPEYGIFCSDVFPSYRQAGKAARSACRRGSSVYADNSKPTMTKSGWAVWFGDYDNCPGNYSSRGKCTEETLDEWSEYCNEDNFICKKCLHYGLFDQHSPLMIPDHYNALGQCDSKGKLATHEGCCPSCPTINMYGYQHGQCSTVESAKYLPYEYCMTDCDFCSDSEGIMCSTCPAYHTLPEYPNAAGQCSDPNHELYWQGCCSNVNCPSGYAANEMCNITADCHTHQYCTEKGVCCELCYNIKVIPETVNSDGSCTTKGYNNHWGLGCCPTCPNIWEIPMGICDNNTDCPNGQYCTYKGICCYENCPDGSSSGNHCEDSHDCHLDQYCTPEGFCCNLPMELCPNGAFRYNYCNTDTECNTDMEFCSLQFGLCCSSVNLFCPYGHYSRQLCTETSACDVNEYCTPNGVCCQRGHCPYGWSSDTECSTDNDCENVYEYCEHGYCCTIPDCHDGTRPSNDKNCSTVHNTCESGEYCNIHSYCCPIPTCYDFSTPIQVCYGNYECDSDFQCAGVCCPLPLCLDGSQPSSWCSDHYHCSDPHINHCTGDGLCCPMPNCTDGTAPSNSCTNHHDCYPRVEHCTDAGICCPLPSCPDGSQPTSSCSDHYECSDPAAEHCFDNRLCCPIPLCPDGLQPISQCNYHYDCLDMTTEYCTGSGVCCPMPPCPDGSHPTSSCYDHWWCPNLNADHCTEDGLCCPMPTCPSGIQPTSSCLEHFDCPNHMYEVCTEDRLCCPLPPCPSGVQPSSSCLGHFDCPNHMYEVCTEDGLCCPIPSCPSGVQPSSSCLGHFDCPNPMYEVCTEDGLCCPLPPCPDGSDPKVACPPQDHNYCSPDEYCSPEGICCMKPICSDGVSATHQCLDSTDCQSGEHCTPSGFCCPIPG